MKRTWTGSILLGAGVLLAGCGDGAGPVAGGEGRDEGLLAFVRCMRGEGIPLADPVETGDGKVEVMPAPGQPLAGRAAFDAAVAACERRGLRRFGDGSRPGGDRSREDGAVAFARCVRRLGIDLPDPRFRDGEVANWAPSELGIDIEAPAVVAVGERCARETGFDPWEEL